MALSREGIWLCSHLNARLEVGTSPFPLKSGGVYRLIIFKVKCLFGHQGCYRVKQTERVCVLSRRDMYKSFISRGG